MLAHRRDRRGDRSFAKDRQLAHCPELEAASVAEHHEVAVALAAESACTLQRSLVFDQLQTAKPHDHRQHAPGEYHSRAASARVPFLHTRRAPRCDARGLAACDPVDELATARTPPASLRQARKSQSFFLPLTFLIFLLQGCMHAAAALWRSI